MISNTINKIDRQTNSTITFVLCRSVADYSMPILDFKKQKKKGKKGKFSKDWEPQSFN